MICHAMGSGKRRATFAVPSTRKGWSSDRDVGSIIASGVFQRSQSQRGLDRFIMCWVTTEQLDGIWVSCTRWTFKIPIYFQLRVHHSVTGSDRSPQGGDCQPYFSALCCQCAITSLDSPVQSKGFERADGLAAWLLALVSS